MTRLTADDFNSLYREHARRVQGFFLRMVGGDRPLAEDMTQELFSRLWESRSRYDGTHPFTTWMYSAAYNLCKNHYRHSDVAANATSQPEENLLSPAADETLLREEQKQLLSEAVGRLPEGIREVFLLRYEEELPIREVAQILGIPEGTVKSRAYNALQTLQQAMRRIR